MNIASQTSIFLNACILGLFLGAVYDLFRITRIAFKSCNVIIFIEDLMFFLITTISSFIFVVMNNQGVFRWALIIGEILGGILYFCTLSIFVIKAAHLIINTIKAILRFIYKITIKPFVSLIIFIFNKIKPIVKNLIVKKNKVMDLTELSDIEGNNTTLNDYIDN